MFDNFPYTDMHQLNLDWIIKIAKDFLDQYTHIQQLIEDGETSLQNLTESGLQQLQDKADNLEGLLQAWYNEHSEDIAAELASALADLNAWYTEHSEDIAGQLASALSDLNAWYTEHQGYLDQYVTDSIAAFNTAAENKAAETIASIPDDYTALANKVTNLEKVEPENGVMYFPEKNLIADPLIVNTPVFTSGEVVNDDAGNIAHITNAGSTARVYLELSEEVSANTTVYVQMILKGSAAGLTSRCVAALGGNTDIIHEMSTPADWTTIKFSAVVPNGMDTLLITLNSVGQLWVKGVIVSKTEIDYDFTVKETVKRIAPIADDLANGVGLNNLQDNLKSVFDYNWGLFPITIEEGFVTTDGSINTYSGYHAAIPVTAGQLLELKAQHGGDMKMFVMVNSSSQVVEYYPADRVSTHTETKEYVAPENGTLYLNSFARSDMQVKFGRIVAIALAGLKGKTWYALGDSITEYEYAYHTIIAKETGLIVTNGGVSGSGYMKPINNQTFVDRANLGTVYDKVTVMGSINDMSYVAEHLGTETDTGTATLGGCFNTLIDNLYASGNYHIGIIAPIPNDSFNGNPANSSGTFAQYIDLLEKVCKRRGVPFLNLWKCSNLQPWNPTFKATYFFDDTHPNALGNAIFAPRIKAFVESL